MIRKIDKKNRFVSMFNPDTGFYMRTGEEDIIPEDELIVMDDWELWSDFYTEGGYYEVPECVCPICQFTEYSENDMFRYLLKEYNLNPNDVLTSWKERFGTYDKFNDWLRKE